MLKTLLKKQMAEIFRNYFYDPKKNKMRSRGATAMYIALYVLLMAGVLGGMFALLAVGICAPMAAANSLNTSAQAFRSEVQLLQCTMATGIPLGVVTISISLYGLERAFSRTIMANTEVPAETFPVR